MIKKKNNKKGLIGIPVVAFLFLCVAIIFFSTDDELAVEEESYVQVQEENAATRQNEIATLAQGDAYVEEQVDSEEVGTYTEDSTYTVDPSYTETSTYTEEVGSGEEYSYAVQDTVAPEGGFSFNPYVCSQKIIEMYGEERIEAFFNFVEAARAGEDYFACPSKEIYSWCLRSSFMNDYFPGGYGCFDADLENGYEDGYGRIVYKISKEEFVAREQEFENEIMDIVNTYARNDYDDFEKCLSLYVYIERNYFYDHDEKDAKDLPDYKQLVKEYYGTCRTLFEKQGVCRDLCSLYNYLLLQCGVDALKYRSDTMHHAWSYVIVDGVGYFVDPTPALTEYIDDEVKLNYFLMPSTLLEKKSEGDMGPAKYGSTNTYINENVDFSANDNSYKPLRMGNYIDMDRGSRLVTIRNRNSGEVEYFAY